MRLPRSAVTKVLDGLDDVEKEMLKFQDYISAQDSKNKPLHQWSPYECYPRLDKAIQNLNKRTEALKDLNANAIAKLLKEPIDEIQDGKARKYSTSISNMAANALQVAARKVPASVDEVDKPRNSAAETAFGIKTVYEEDDGSIREKAEQKILTGVRQLLDHMTRATSSVYSAVDALNSCTQVASRERLWGDFVDNTKHLGDFRGLTWTGFFFLLAIASVFIYGSFQHGYITMGPGRATSLTNGTAISSSIGTICTGLETSISALANVTEIRTYQTAVQNADLNARLNALETQREDTDSRIDNIWDSLGLPNQHGVYFAISKPYDRSRKVDKESAILREELRMVAQEVMALRTYLSETDQRLTSEVKKVQDGE